MDEHGPNPGRVELGRAKADGCAVAALDRAGRRGRQGHGIGTIDADRQAVPDGTCEQGKIRARSTPEVENTLTRPGAEQLCLPGRRSGSLPGHPLHQGIGLIGPVDIVECSYLHVRHRPTVGRAMSGRGRVAALERHH
jgi:hypothetical protein